MSSKNKSTRKLNLHPKNQHNSLYDFALLCLKHPALKSYVYRLEGRDSIDFSQPTAVINLNSALLKTYYNIQYWELPQGYLCPPIPGRVDYIHYLADLLQTCLGNEQIAGNRVTVLDIGTGASCIYPILGQRCYRWSFVASDIDPVSVASAYKIIHKNKQLSKYIKVKKQENSSRFFEGIIAAKHSIDLTMCNPPFHSSLSEAMQGNSRKRHNLDKKRKIINRPSNPSPLNFGGQKAELFCPGGELTFIKSMIAESTSHAHQVLYFTCLVSKKEHLFPLKVCLKKYQAADVQVIEMSQGNKISRFIAWSFLDKAQRQRWCKDKLAVR